MKLDAKQMQAFFAVAETGSFEKAAERLRVTPSAVSQRIHALEVRLGSSVIIRGRPCESTPIGKKLMHYLRRATVLEDELLNEISGDDDGHLRMVMAVNGDTLATWFFPALADIFINEKILLEILVEDQDHTYSLLESGQVIGCIGTQALPMRGCFVKSLGSMRYVLVASPAFQAQWFPDGLSREAAFKAPVFAYSRKDTLHSDFLRSRFGLHSNVYPVHYLSLPQARLKAIRRGLGYGMIPLAQVDDMLKKKELVDVSPGQFIDLELYWHAWSSQSPRLEALSERAVDAARRVLSNQEPHKRPKIQKNKSKKL
ncbi:MULTISPECIES: HTH-type transcriptional regulator ArgP [unclassified Pseudomonas]|uniref:HTH-type transcriptional regulator ArgP n=1 Tax=unclassified Pseudomonas TaxID=196821 RepID=UPI000A1F84A4|nr:MULTISPECIES: HTH-type transcriptional regulator ArgP [unclassified Pseudomonas]